RKRNCSRRRPRSPATAAMSYSSRPNSLTVRTTANNTTSRCKTTQSMRALLQILLIGCSLQSVAAEDRTVDAITIKSMWGGILEGSETEVAYSRRDGQMFLNKRPVDPRKVQSLIETLNARPVPRDKAFTARIFQLWLDRHAPFAANLQPGWGGTAW